MSFAKLSVFNFTASQLRAVEEYAKASAKFREFLLKAVGIVEKYPEEDTVSDFRDLIVAKLPKSTTKAAEPKSTKAKSTTKPKSKKSTKADSFDLKALLVEAVEASIAKLSQADDDEEEVEEEEVEEAVKPTKSKKSTTKAKPKADEVDDEEADDEEEAKVTRYHYFASGPVSKVDQRNLPWLVSASRKPGEDIFVRFGYRAKSFQSASFPIKRLREAIQKHSARLLSELDEAEEQLS